MRKESEETRYTLDWLFHCAIVGDVPADRFQNWMKKMQVQEEPIQTILKKYNLQQYQPEDSVYSIHPLLKQVICRQLGPWEMHYLGKMFHLSGVYDKMREMMEPSS